MLAISLHENKKTFSISRPAKTKQNKNISEILKFKIFNVILKPLKKKFQVTSKSKLSSWHLTPAHGYWNGHTTKHGCQKFFYCFSSHSQLNLRLAANILSRSTFVGQLWPSNRKLILKPLSTAISENMANNFSSLQIILTCNKSESAIITTNNYQKYFPKNQQVAVPQNETTNGRHTQKRSKKIFFDQLVLSHTFFRPTCPKPWLHYGPQSLSSRSALLASLSTAPQQYCCRNIFRHTFSSIKPTQYTFISCIATRLILFDKTYF